MYANGGIFLITTLTVEEKQGKNAAARFWNLIRGDSLKTEIFEINETIIREITYKKRRKSINPEKISAAAGNQREYIVCSEGIFKNGEAGLYRFYAPRFEGRMCSNFALECVRQMKTADRSLKIGVLDNFCSCTDIVRNLLRFSDNVTVVSSTPDEYGYVADEILSDCGASFLLTVDPSALGDCRLLIAPERIKLPLSLSSRTLVLTVAPPVHPIGGQVYWKYSIELPLEAEALRPKGIDEVYFASALYTKARCHSLGTLIPTLVSNLSSAHTPQSAALAMEI